jgi:zinc D-Ala-D-Ala carboxypeptidase
MQDILRERYRAELSRMSMLPYYDISKREQYIEYKLKNEQCTWVDVITYVNIGLHEDCYKVVQRITDPYSLKILVNKYNKLGETFMPKDMETIDEKYNPEGLLLRHDARIAFEEMCRAAEREGIHLEAISTFRSFYYQWKIYLKDITPVQSIEEYSVQRDKVSARPGHSEHQTGLAVDINDLEQTFENTEEGKWLALSAFNYGFILRYPKWKEKITGYNFEPWHYRYLGKELSQSIFYSDLTYDEFYSRYLIQPNKGILYE